MTPEQKTELQKTLCRLPAVGEALELPAVREAAAGLPRPFLTALAREAIEEMRTAIRRDFERDNGHADGMPAPQPHQCRQDACTTTPEAAAARIVRRIEALRRPHVARAINASGIILHTGLGRAPLAAEAIRAVEQTASGYCDVAASRATGGRRRRSEIVADLLRALTGCEAALVVNNNAAATVLALAAHASGREAIISRGQLVEIGGSFRLPEVMASAGAVLREVGTTNRTRRADYEAAIGENAAAILRVHPSNFRIVGFSESVGIGELADLAHRHGLVAIDDVGSGALIDLAPFGLTGESVVADSIAAGADLVLFSGDKLLGGPQAGILVGRREAVERCARHPLMRAFRPDKMTMAALDATLRLYLEPERLAERLPALRMIAEPAERVRERAERLKALIASEASSSGQKSWSIEILEDAAYAGGGSLPDRKLPTWVAAIADPPGGVEAVKRRLREGDPPVFARARRDRLELDMRTVRDEDVEDLSRRLRLVWEITETANAKGTP